MEDTKLEVYFDEYCRLCKYSGTSEVKDPCNDCLANPMNENSHKPVFWKSKEK